MNNDSWEELPRIMSRDCKRMVFVASCYSGQSTKQDNARFNEILKKHDPSGSLNGFVDKLVDHYQQQVDDLSEQERALLESPENPSDFFYFIGGHANAVVSEEALKYPQLDSMIAGWCEYKDTNSAIYYDPEPIDIIINDDEAVCVLRIHGTSTPLMRNVSGKLFFTKEEGEWKLSYKSLFPKQRKQAQHQRQSTESK